MRAGLPVSVLLHAGVIAWGVLALPSALPPPVKDTPIIPVELVSIGDVTNIVVKPKPAPKPKDEVEKLAPDPLLVTESKPEPEPEKAEIIPPDPTEKKPPPKPEPKKPVKKEPPKPVPKPKPAPKPKPKPAFDLAALEKKIEQHPAKNADTSPDGLDFSEMEQSLDANAKMTATEIDLLKARMYECWRAPLDAPDPEKMVVRVRIHLNRDGTLQGAPIVLEHNKIESSGDPFWVAAANSARRAVIKCQPYELPPEKYTSWKDITLRFSAAEMMRGSR